MDIGFKVLEWLFLVTLQWNLDSGFYKQNFPDSERFFVFFLLMFTFRRWPRCVLVSGFYTDDTGHKVY